jgi:hypothetical protein
MLDEANLACFISGSEPKSENAASVPVTLDRVQSLGCYIMLEELLLLIQIPLKFQTEFLSSHVFNRPSIPRLFFLLLVVVQFVNCK